MQLFLAVNSQQKSTKKQQQSRPWYRSCNIQWKICQIPASLLHRTPTNTSSTNINSVQHQYDISYKGNRFNTHYSATVNRGTNTKPHTHTSARQTGRETELKLKLEGYSLECITPPRPNSPLKFLLKHTKCCAVRHGPR